MTAKEGWRWMEPADLDYSEDAVLYRDGERVASIEAQRYWLAKFGSNQLLFQDKEKAYEACEGWAAGAKAHACAARLSSLPDDLQAAAAEFLTLHDAWDTEFRVESITSKALTGKMVIGNTLAIFWGSVLQGGGRGRLRCVPRVHEESGGFTWRLTWDEGWQSKIEWEWHGPLRRSADFAEFVQRFKVLDEAPQ